jgi:uncharacterized damage-inducible protein DinB
MATETITTQTTMTPEALRIHWQGHRCLTRKIIAAFPEDKLFDFSIGGMRPFAALAMEFIKMAVPVAKGVATDVWPSMDDVSTPTTKAALLELWDQQTAELDKVWSTIAPERFSATVKAFGLYDGTGISITMYAIDNEIHHRGQGYVYLRALGIEPPPFWERNC